MTIFALAIGAYIQWISTGGNFLQLLPSVSLEWTIHSLWDYSSFVF